MASFSLKLRDLDKILGRVLVRSWQARRPKTRTESRVDPKTSRSLEKLSSVVGFWSKIGFLGGKTQHAAVKLIFRAMLSFYLENGYF